MKRTNTPSDALNRNKAVIDVGDGLPPIELPLDGNFGGGKGDPGEGVPTGGAPLQVVRKNVAGTTTEWATPSKSMVGLSNVDNTADVDKPISAATQIALDEKASATSLTNGLNGKADLSNGKVPISQLPTDALVTDASVDGVNKNLIENPASLTAGALSAAIAEGVDPVRDSAAVIGDLVTALDMRDPRSLVIAQASDSTGDSAAEWFETSWKELLASKWPDRPARVKRWIKATDVYGAMETWQTAYEPGGTESLTLGLDTFATVRASLDGTNAETGGPWAVTGGTGIAVSGGVAKQSASGLSVATLPNGNHDVADGITTVVASLKGTGSVQQFTIYHAMSDTSSAADRLDVLIGGTASITPLLRVTAGGSTTTLATFSSGLVSLNTSTPTSVNVSITVDGLSVTAVVNGETKTATLTTAQRTAIADAHSGFMFSNAGEGSVDSFERTGFLTTSPAASPLSYLTAYNAGYAGGRASHQLDRLDAMFPELPDALFINHGHNYGSVDSTPELFLAAIQAFVDAFHVKYPGVPVVCLSQNPEFEGTMATTDEVAQHAARQRALRGYCLRKGWGYIPSFEAFAAIADFGRNHVDATDGIHPTPSGMRLQTDTAKAWVSAQSKRP